MFMYKTSIICVFIMIESIIEMKQGTVTAWPRV
jgi:hypothetical protein